MFDQDEVEALLLGAKMVRTWSDQQLAASASSALNKIIAVLPENLQALEQSSPIKVPDFQKKSTISPFSEEIRQAIKQNRTIQISYSDASEHNTSRTLWPLGIFFWGKVWTLLAWCKKRNAYRVFRLDRITTLVQTNQAFETSITCSLEHYLAVQRSQHQYFVNVKNND